MWLILAIIAAVVYFLFFYKEPQRKNSRNRNSSKRQQSQNSKADIPGINWIFQREIDEPGVPPIINTYRKKLNGYDYKKLVQELKVISIIEEDTQRNMAFLQYLEPLAELERKGLFEMNKDMPHLFFEHFIFDLFQFLRDYYPAIGAIGQIKNFEEIFNYIPETRGFLTEMKLANSAYIELKSRNEILEKIKNEGFIYKKDLEKLESFKSVTFKEYLINRLILYKQIESDKKGRFIIYKLKEK